jgi:hypothetical protein
MVREGLSAATVIHQYVRAVWLHVCIVDGSRLSTAAAPDLSFTSRGHCCAVSSVRG